jgi:F0F1-type ATP synthase membrane subunit b/b'
LNGNIDAHVVAYRKVTDRISQELNACSGRLLEDVKGYKAETENSLKEFRQEYSQLREELNAGQTTWQNKAGGEMDKMRDSVRLA